MQVWLKLWMFLDENDDLDSLSDISKRSGISYPSVLDAVKMFEDVNYVNVVMENGKKKIVKTDRWNEIRDNLRNIHKSLDDKKAI